MSGQGLIDLADFLGLKMSPKKQTKSRFPLNQCSNHYLKETKKSIKEAIAHSLKCYMREEEKEEEDYDYDDYEYESNDEDHQDEDYHDKESTDNFVWDVADMEISNMFHLHTRPKHPSTKILKNDLELQNWSYNVATANIKDVIRERFGEHEPGFLHIENSVVNMVLSEYQLEDVCRSKDFLIDIIDGHFLEKFTMTKLDGLYDRFIETASGHELFYPMFKDVWKYEPTDVNSFTYDDYEAMFRTSPLSEDKESRDLKNVYCNGFLMNIEKAALYYKRDIKLGDIRPVATRKLSVSSSATLHSSSETFNVLEHDEGRWSISSGASSISSVDSKSVHFDDSTETVNFSNHEPSFYVFCDLNNVKMTEIMNSV